MSECWKKKELISWLAGVGLCVQYSTWWRCMHMDVSTHAWTSNMKETAHSFLNKLLNHSEHFLFDRRSLLRLYSAKFGHRKWLFVVFLFKKPWPPPSVLKSERFCLSKTRGWHSLLPWNCSLGQRHKNVWKTGKRPIFELTITKLHITKENFLSGLIVVFHRDAK